VFDNVLIQPRDAREASDVFYRQRLGDVLLTYENEVVLTNQVRARMCGCVCVCVCVCVCGCVCAELRVLMRRWRLCRAAPGARHCHPTPTARTHARTHTRAHTHTHTHTHTHA
jgi:hypothetical protein